jgi:hypothetical protein
LRLFKDVLEAVFLAGVARHKDQRFRPPPQWAV